jgi:DNA-binding NtrC family response regulator
MANETNMMKQVKEHEAEGVMQALYRNESMVGINAPESFDAIQPKAHILILDNEILPREQLAIFYAANGYTVEVADSVEEGLNRVNSKKIDVVIVYSDLPGGGEVLQKLEREHPQVSVIMTGYLPIDHYDQDLQYGNYDYMAKPFQAEIIHNKTKNALDKSYVFAESTSLRQALKGTEGDFGLLLSKTPAMHQIFETMRMASPTNMSVVLEGEAGTGKELIASAIHYQSSRRDGPFVAVNCAAYPDSLLETELFGCEGGGPFKEDLKRPGKIKLSSNGTLFLDEIESMAPFVQSKFLQMLEDWNRLHLGEQQSLDSDVRVIAASNVPLQQLIAQGKIRADLYYRINVVPIQVLPLRERAADIPLLIGDFLRWHPIAIQKHIVGVSSGTIARLIQYPWPGNIRELQNVLEKAIVLTKDSVIDNIDLPSTNIRVN